MGEKKEKNEMYMVVGQGGKLVCTIKDRQKRCPAQEDKNR